MSTHARVRLYMGLLLVAGVAFVFGLTVLGLIAVAAWVIAMVALHDW